MELYKRHSISAWVILAGFAILALLSGCPAVAQNVVVKYPGYTSYWNATTKIPDSVVYIATPHKKIAARAATFHTSGGMLNEDRDYKGSGYDQGHLCNASDENGNAIDEYNSFDQHNIYPQRPNCNRLTWLALENYIRGLGVPIKVWVGWHGIAGYMGGDKIVIPAYCDKIIWYNGKCERYSMPNCDTVNRHLFIYYRVK